MASISSDIHLAYRERNNEPFGDIGNTFILDDVGRGPVDDEKIRLFTQALTVANQGSDAPALTPNALGSLTLCVSDN